jgi:hypothetical protein
VAAAPKTKTCVSSPLRKVRLSYAPSRRLPDMCMQRKRETNTWVCGTPPAA